MRSTIDIDETLLQEAMKLTRVKTKRELIHMSLREIIDQKRRQRLAERIGTYTLNLSLDDLKKIRIER